ncbi:hypothetical protein [Alkanindiges illinoisensis]|uniref:hypothetical protein n=1 Tax=Alkanindiges illinoisensis TaxID=197183 RepID=UPI00047A231D|nr:hypothetical protein [Alkanindiges illinoisensis]
MSLIKTSFFLSLLILKSISSYAASLENTENSRARSELLTTITDSFAIHDFLNAVRNASQSSDEWKNCVTSNDTVQKVAAALSKEVNKTIQPLNDQEVIVYANFFKDGGTTALSKYYQSNYRNAVLSQNGKKVSAHKVIHNLLSSFSEQERQAWNSSNSLPNVEVRNLLMPLADKDKEMFRTMYFGLTMRWAAEDSCQKFSSQKVPNGK